MKEMLAFARDKHADALKAIATEKELTDEIQEKLDKLLSEFRKIFVPTEQD